MNCQIPCAEYVNNRADHASLRVKSTEESKSNELLNNSYDVVEVMMMKIQIISQHFPFVNF